MTYYESLQDKQNKNFAKALRKHMTNEERHLWFDFLRNYPVRILRQKRIAGYIVDFYCAKAKLVIEIDGSQHCEDHEKIYDEKRTRELENLGLKVIRISNFDVWLNFDPVREWIHNVIQERIKNLAKPTTATRSPALEKGGLRKPGIGIKE